MHVMTHMTIHVLKATSVPPDESLAAGRYLDQFYQNQERSHGTITGRQRPVRYQRWAWTRVHSVPPSGPVLVAVYVARNPARHGMSEHRDEVVPDVAPGAVSIAPPPMGSPPKLRPSAPQRRDSATGQGYAAGTRAGRALGPVVVVTPLVTWEAEIYVYKPGSQILPVRSRAIPFTSYVSINSE